MPRQIIIAEQYRIAAVFAEEQIQELIVASGEHQVGDVCMGIVENVLPSIDAAFINIGTERNGFIHVSDLGPIKLRRSSAAITELVAPQQKVLVQVMKEPTGNKGPRLTGEVSLPGRYLVLMPDGRGVNLSRRILDQEERNRLKSLAILVKPSQMGLLVRTEAEGVPDEAIIEDLEILQRQWDEIQELYPQARTPGLLNRDSDFIQRVLRDTFSADVNRIVTDSQGSMKRVKQQLQAWNQGQMPAGVFVDFHQDPAPILDYFRVNAAIQQALRPRVDLPSGGYIIIEPTEALTVIDVNSGSFTQSATARETVLWTNCEAATEIARQLKLRNIAGVIVVDFIDMDARKDQLQVLEHFNKAVRSDKARPQVAQLSELGLVELTRKRQGQSIYELFGRPCPHCDGLGLLANLPGAHSDEGSPILDTSRAAVFAGINPAFISQDADGNPISGSGDRDRRGGGYKSRSLRSERGSSSLSRRRGRTRPEETEKSYDNEKPYDKGFDKAFEEKEKPSKEVIRRVVETAPVLEEAKTAPTPVSKEGKEERERSRESRRKVIRVEMTPLQQSVYSEMGLSPLLLLPEPVAKSRDTVVAVVLPGQGDLESPEMDPIDTNGSIDTNGTNGFDTEDSSFDVDEDRDTASQKSATDSADWDDEPLEEAPQQIEAEQEPPSQFSTSPTPQRVITRRSAAPEPEAAPAPAVEPIKASPVAARRRRSRS